MIRDFDRRPIALTCIDSLSIVLRQMQHVSYGVKLSDIVDIAVPDAYMQIAMAE